MRSRRNVGKDRPETLLHDEAEHDVARIAVAPKGPRHEPAGLLGLQELEDAGVVDLGFLDGEGGVGRRHEVLVVGEARGVVEEMTHGDGPAVLREVREEAGQAVLVAELAVAHEHHHRHRGELFCDRGQPEDGPAVDRAHALHVRDAARAEIGDLSVSQHEDPGPRLARGSGGGEEGVGELIRLVCGPGRPGIPAAAVTASGRARRSAAASFMKGPMGMSIVSAS